WNNSTWLSFNGTAGNAVDNNKISIQYDLGSKKSVSSISLNTLNDFASGQGIGVPKGLKVMVSDNGERWTVLKNFKRPTPADPCTFKYEWDGKTDSYITTLESANMIYTQFIKIEADIDTWIAFDEIEVLGKDGKCSTAGTLIGTPDADKNLAAGKAYTIDHKAPRAYQDENGVELTDSQFGNSSMYDLSWQGHTGEWPTRTVVIDLEKKHSISSVKANFLAAMGSGVNLPTAVRLYVSDDGLTWSNLYLRNGIKTNANGIFTLGWDSQDLDGFEATNAALVNARYVRADIELEGWCFFDEIEVYGKDGVVADGIELPKDANFEGALMTPGEKTDNIKDMVLVYNGPYRDYEGNLGYGNWSVADFKPYVGYINEKGIATDTMYDAFLFLAMGAESNNLFIESSGYDSKPSNKTDWEWFLSKTFDKNKDMYNLNESAKIVAKETNNLNLKAKVTVMVPFPDALSTNFGEINGKNLDLSNVDDCKIAIDWYMNEVLTRFAVANYEHLEFSGFYWMHETNYRSDLIKYTSDKTHEANHEFFWIPYYNASGWNRWAEMGVDAVVLQPNHFFPESTPPSLDRLSDASTLAKMYGMGLEIEMDERAFTDVNRYNKYLDYLNGSIQFGYLNNCYRNWYNGIKGLMEAAYANNPLAQSDNPHVRALYDYTYQVIKGTYTMKPYLTSLDQTPEASKPTPTPDSDSSNTPIQDNNNTGVIITVPAEVTNIANPVLEVAELPEWSHTVTELANIATNFNIEKTFQINLYDRTTKVTVVEGGKIKVEIPFAGQAGKAYSVLRYHDDGTITELKAIYSDGKIKFETDHFSVYAIATKVTETEIKPTTPPTTSDTTPIQLSLVLIMLAIGLFGLGKKRLEIK
ncbi:MAG: DUF4855 domain-containing protein, partial [Oscillospiraceae bacterium]